MNENTWPFTLICGGLLVFLLAVSFFSQRYSLNNIKSKTVGDGESAAQAAEPHVEHVVHVVCDPGFGEHEAHEHEHRQRQHRIPVEQFDRRVEACTPSARTSSATAFSRASLRAISATFAPCFASASAVARPMPEDAPVTMAFFPISFCFIVTSQAAA